MLFNLSVYTMSLVKLTMFNRMVLLLSLLNLSQEVTVFRHTFLVVGARAVQCLLIEFFLGFAAVFTSLERFDTDA